MRTHRPIVIVSFFVFGRAAAAETASSTIAPVIVTAPNSGPLPITDPSATVTTFGAQAIERARERGQELSDLADTVAGVRVLDLGGPLRERWLTLRGGSPAQALVVIDGIPLRTPFATGFDLGLIGLESVTRMTLLRGGAGASLGDGALSGALLITPRSPRDPEAAARVSYGSFETTAVRASGSAAPVLASAAFERSSGDFPYVSALPGLPALAAIRANNDASRGQGSLRFETALGGGKLSAFAGGALRLAGVPGLETQANLQAREERGAGQAGVGFRRAPGEDRLGVEASAWAAGMSIDYQDPRIGLRSETRFLSLGGELALRGRPFEGHGLAARLELSGDLAEASLDASRARAALAVEDVAAFGDLTPFVALRAAWTGGQRPALLPRLGARWQALPELAFSAAIGRSLRTPSIDELHHPLETGFSGNPDLASETAWDAELSLESEPIAERIRVAVSGWARRAEDLILYVNRDAFLIRPENVGAANSAGLELELSLLPPPILGALVLLDLSGGLLDSALEVTGRPLPTQPRAAFDAELSAALPALGFPLSIFARARYAAPTTANLQATLQVPAYFRLDAGFTVKPVGGAALSLLLTNLTDDRTLQTVHKIPLPGFGALASLSVSSRELP